MGATDITYVPASFSDYGSCVDLLVPGVNIVSDWFASPFTQTVSGTSMASPHVAGVRRGAPWRLCPSATVGDVTNAVLANATSGTVGAAGVGSPNPSLYSGFTSGDAGASAPGAVRAERGCGRWQPRGAPLLDAQCGRRAGNLSEHLSRDRAGR